MEELLESFKGNDTDLCILGLYEQSLRFDKNHRLLVALRKGFDPSLNPRFSALHFHSRGPQDGICIRWHGFSVVDIQVRSDANPIGQHGETASGQPLIEDGRQQASVNDPRMTTDVRAQVEDGNHVPPGLLRPHIRWDDNPVWPGEGTASEVSTAKFFGDLQVRARLRVGRVGAQLLRERMCLDMVVDLTRALVDWLVELEGLRIGWYARHGSSSGSQGKDREPRKICNNH